MRNSTKLLAAVLMLLTVSATAFAQTTSWDGTAGPGSQPIPDWVLVNTGGQIPMNPWVVVLDTTIFAPQLGHWGINFQNPFYVALDLFEGRSTGVYPATGTWYYWHYPNWAQGTINGYFDFNNGTASGTWTYTCSQGSYTGNWEGHKN